MKSILTLAWLFGLWCLKALACGVAATTAILLMCATALAEPVKVCPANPHYLMLFHGKNDGQWGAHFVVTPGKFEETLTLISVPPGDYGLEWIEPATGTVKRKEAMTHSGGNFQVTTPPYTMDVALRMRRSEMFGSEASEAGGAAEKPQTYATAFNLAEDPISEGGKWINNRTVGPHWWHDVMITNEIATGIGFDMTSEAGFTDFTVTCTGGEREKPAKEKP